MGNKSERLMRRFGFEEIGGEANPQLPIVEVAGEGRVLVEHHRGVIAYTREEVRIRVNYGSVLVTGMELELRKMHRMQLIVAGKIDKIILERW